MTATAAAPHMDTDRLAVEAARGGWEALASLYQEYADRLYRYVHCQLAGNVHAAEDVCSEVWLNVTKSIHTYRPEGTFVAWLFSIARNTIRDLFRRQTRRLETPTADMLAASDGLVLAGPGSDADATAAILSAAVKRLPVKQQAVITSRFYLGLSLSETAAVLDCSVDAVKGHQSRAVKALRSQVEELRPVAARVIDPVTDAGTFSSECEPAKEESA